MKRRMITGLTFLSAVLAFGILAGCSDDNDEITEDNTISAIEKEALLFMLEEEKMARDVYYYLDDEWNRTEFKNIGKSEENHMAAIENLLNLYQVEYEILPVGAFNNSDLQEAYLVLTELGEENVITALLVGAGIEDLDIYDLENYMSSLNTSRIIDVFSSLQCGSRNHLRAFTTSLTNLGVSFEPQFLDEEAYLSIITSDNENCGL